MAAKAATPALEETQAFKLQSPYVLDLDAAAALGREASGKTLEVVTITKPSDMEGVPSSVPVALVRGDNPHAASVHTLFENYRTHPARKAGTATAQTFESFCDLVNRHKTEHSAIFADADWREPSFTAVIDYHEAKNAGRAAYMRHRVHYAFPLSEEWKKWTEKNGEAMKQDQFAWFLEDRVPELSAPTDHEKVTLEHQFATTIATPAQLIELSRGLQIHVDTRVKASQTLQTGEGQIQWEEAHNGADGKPIKVPGLFILSIAPFFMGEKIRIPVRLRYRVKEGQTIWFYQIYRPDQYITEHVRHTLFDAKENTGLPTYEGKPETAS
jgi:uncharacterized protein YfdQ (DUF2303 family)